MATHQATIAWRRHAADNFLSGRYSREHTWTFDGGQMVPASPSPSVVPVPYSNPASVDPEEAFVAAIASCHMLTFLYLASRRGFQIASYDDTAVGRMAKTDRGVEWVSHVTLAPRIVYDGPEHPTPDDETQLHDAAHDQCFIANSVKTEIVVIPLGEENVTGGETTPGSIS